MIYYLILDALKSFVIIIYILLFDKQRPWIKEENKMFMDTITRLFECNNNNNNNASEYRFLIVLYVIPYIVHWVWMLSLVWAKDILNAMF